MLKLNTSFSKKVQGDTRFTSKGFLASIETELPDGLTQDQIRARIHDAFSLVRDSVETEINGKPAIAVPIAPAQAPQANGYGKNGHLQATKKQVNYLLDLAKEKAVDITPFLRRLNAGSAYDLNREQCSRMIDQIR